MNPFAKQDELGRAKTVQLFQKYELVASVDQYAVWDLSGMTVNIAGDVNPFLMEIKDRNVTSTDYNTVFMEWKKYQSLLKVADENQIEDVFYITHFNDKVSYVFNVKKIKVHQLKLSVIKAPKTSMCTTEMVDKIMVELNFNQGKKYYSK